MSHENGEFLLVQMRFLIENSRHDVAKQFFDRFYPQLAEINDNSKERSIASLQNEVFCLALLQRTNLTDESTIESIGCDLKRATKLQKRAKKTIPAPPADNIAAIEEKTKYLKHCLDLAELYRLTKTSRGKSSLYPPDSLVFSESEQNQVKERGEHLFKRVGITQPDLDPDPSKSLLKIFQLQACIDSYGKICEGSEEENEQDIIKAMYAHRVFQDPCQHKPIFMGGLGRDLMPFFIFGWVFGPCIANAEELKKHPEIAILYEGSIYSNEGFLPILKGRIMCINPLCEVTIENIGLYPPQVVRNFCHRNFEKLPRSNDYEEISSLESICDEITCLSLMKADSARNFKRIVELYQDVLQHQAEYDLEVPSAIIENMLEKVRGLIRPSPSQVGSFAPKVEEGECGASASCAR